MATTQYVQPTLTAETYDVKTPTNFGQDYGQAITNAGGSLASAITAVGGQYTQNKQVDDTLAAMNQSKMLPDEDYQAVAGKSLGAKQTMLGMYAGQFLADQAEQRQAALNKGQAVNTMTVEHQKLLDQINAVKTGYGAAAGVPTGKLQVNVVKPTPQQNQQVVQQPATPAVAPTVQTGPPISGNLILKPGVVRAQATNPKTGQMVTGWMNNGVFQPNPP